jgi:hypothetical protein
MPSGQRSQRGSNSASRQQGSREASAGSLDSSPRGRGHAGGSGQWEAEARVRGEGGRDGKEGHIEVQGVRMLSWCRRVERGWPHPSARVQAPAPKGRRRCPTHPPTALTPHRSARFCAATAGWLASPSQSWPSGRGARCVAPTTWRAAHPLARDDDLAGRGPGVYARDTTPSGAIA